MATSLGLIVRVLDRQDAGAYRALRLAGVKAYPAAFQPAYDEALRQADSWAERRLTAHGDTFFGAFIGDELVGAVCLRRHAAIKISHSAELKALVVDPERQRQGIGRALVGHLITQARAAGLRQLTLTVIDGNRSAECLYDAFGFTLFGIEKEAFLLDGVYYAKQHRQLIFK